MIANNGGPGDQAEQVRLAEKLIHRKRFLMDKYDVQPLINPTQPTTPRSVQRPRII